MKEQKSRIKKIKEGNRDEKNRITFSSWNLEKLKMAIIYGADAVYIGGTNFGLRVASKNLQMNLCKKS